VGQRRQQPNHRASVSGTCRGIIYKALGIPTDMFTVFFAIGRMPGWISQWLEFQGDPEKKITRPRQVYMGETQRAYKKVEER
jgi:citrate synthase